MDWKELHNSRRHRPGINELNAYFSDEAAALFTQFSTLLSKQYNVSCAPAIFSVKYGWNFRFGRNGVYLLSGITIADGTFHVNGTAVRDNESYEKAVGYVDSCYSEFKKDYDLIAARKTARQSERTRQRLEREKQEVAAMADLIVPEKFNRYRWSPKVSRRDLSRLYAEDASCLPNEDLADEIGFALYTRCIQGRDVWLDIEAGRLKCHHCGKMLYAEQFMQCTCGYQYLFRDYMRSFRKENMPSGAATHIFNAFIADWEKARGYHEKMCFIDQLIHEFHINLTSGVKGRFVGINLIEGTKKQIADFIMTLAYGENKEAILKQFKADLGP